MNGQATQSRHAENANYHDNSVDVNRAAFPFYIEGLMLCISFLMIRVPDPGRVSVQDVRLGLQPISDNQITGNVLGKPAFFSRANLGGRSRLFFTAGALYVGLAAIASVSPVFPFARAISSFVAAVAAALFAIGLVSYIVGSGSTTASNSQSKQVKLDANSAFNETSNT